MDEEKREVDKSPELNKLGISTEDISILKGILADDSVFGILDKWMKFLEDLQLTEIGYALSKIGLSEEDSKLVGIMRYLKGKQDMLDRVHFYLVKWHADAKKENKKEEENKDG